MDEKVQVNARLDRQLWKEVKMLALQKDVSAASILEDAVRIFMQKSSGSPVVKSQSAGDPSPDQLEAERIIRENDSMSARQLADMLNEAGHRTMRGAAWSQNTVNKNRLKLRRQGVV